MDASAPGDHTHGAVGVGGLAAGDEKRTFCGLGLEDVDRLRREISTGVRDGGGVRREKDEAFEEKPSRWMGYWRTFVDFIDRQCWRFLDVARLGEAG